MDARMRVESALRGRLTERLERGLLRSLRVAEQGVDFYSNDYLGFARLRHLRSEAEAALPVGGTGSRLISGHCVEAERAERRVAAFHGAEAALIFNTGYTANIGLLSAIAGPEDALVLDAYCHASLMDGARLSAASSFKFRHNDLEDLEKKLQCNARNKFVVVESLYSMHGDEAPLGFMAELCARYQAALLVDEAHATGLYGPQGEGLTTHYGLQDAVYARIHTFGKALGLHGAAVVGTATLRDYLVNYARSFIYTTAAPPAFYLHIDRAYQWLPQADRAGLFGNVADFQARAAAWRDVIPPSASPIQAVTLGDNQRARGLAERLGERGILAKAVLSPTVPKGHERVRICLHAFNTKTELDLLFDTLEDYLR